MGKSSILMEVQYLAPVQYYCKLMQYETVFLEQHENYRKGSFRNRCQIATANGVIGLSIPLQKGKNQQTNIRNVKIDNNSNWQTIHWRSIYTAYGKSPFFEYYQDDIYAIYEKKSDLVFDFCLEMQELLLSLLGLAPNIQYTSAFERIVTDDTLDFRNIILPKNYAENRNPNFWATPYPQVFEDRLGFLPNLSILDLLFCAGPEALAYLQQSIANHS